MATLQVGGNGYPVVAWSEYDEARGSNNIYVKQWNGTSWQQLGDVVDSEVSRRAIYPIIAVDKANQISVSWWEFKLSTPENFNVVHAAQWRDGSWQQLGELNSKPNTDARYAVMSLSGKLQKPVIAWLEEARSAYDVHLIQAE
jgi:hypothetical protein